MAKAKYKIENLIRFTRAGSEETSVIEAIVTRKEGHSYLVKGFEGDEVSEDSVLAAYQEKKQRMTGGKKTSSKRSSRSSRANGKAEETAPAQA